MEALSKLGIDFNSVLIYLLNFGVLFVVIAYFITGPILRLIDARKKKIHDNLEEAERIKKEFFEEKKKSDREKEALRLEMQKELQDLKKELDEKRRKEEEAMELKRAKMLEDVRTIVEEEKNSIMAKAEKETLKLMEKVIMHIVSNKIPEQVIRESVDESWKQFRNKAS